MPLFLNCTFCSLEISGLIVNRLGKATELGQWEYGRNYWDRMIKKNVFLTRFLFILQVYKIGHV